LQYFSRRREAFAGTPKLFRPFIFIFIEASPAPDIVTPPPYAADDTPVLYADDAAITQAASTPAGDAPECLYWLPPEPPPGQRVRHDILRCHSQPSQRLYVYIACRSIIWPFSPRFRQAFSQFSHGMPRFNIEEPPIPNELMRIYEPMDRDCSHWPAPDSCIAATG
jgi:hypothetical protein